LTSACPYVPPPAGATSWPAAQPVGKPILAWARGNLKYPMGTIVQAVVAGQSVIARLECHYHPPGGAVRPWGPHKGCTIYWPTAAITPGVTLPTGGVDATAPTTTDPCVLAGDDYYGCHEQSDWGLLAFTAASAAGSIALFLLAIRHAGKAARKR
jgi:hypothetical protein